MPPDTLPDLSPEQNLALKLAAREVAKYCQEFSRWRKTRRGRAALESFLPGGLTPGPVSVQKPQPPSSPSSA
jgi:DNA topoisomerase VI subunit B